jgi:hypothetical protein
MRAVLTVWLFAIVAMFSATQARADECPEGTDPPFADILNSDDFCTEAEWAKAAEITTGCDASGDFFCPYDFVSRAQMVLFLRRMAKATFPVSRFYESSALPPGDLDMGGLACTTSPLNVPTDSYGGVVLVDAVVSMRAGTSAADVELTVYQRVLGVGGAAHFVKPIVTVPAGQWRQASVITLYRPVFPHSTNDWQVVLARAPGSSTTGELTDVHCQIKAITRLP